MLRPGSTVVPRRFRLLLALLGALATPVAARAGWYSASWSYRKEISIDQNRVSGGVDLTDFPVLIDLTTDSDLAANALSTGNDILFTSADGTTKLDHEIEKYTSATGRLTAWVRVPTLAYATNTILYLYYGNAGASSQQNPGGVWTGYSAVYHLNDAGTTLDDSTNNGWNGTATNGPSSTTGKFANGFSFDGTNDYAALGAHNFQAGASAATVSAWVNPNNVSSSPGLVAMSIHNGGTPTATSRLELGLSSANPQITARSDDSTSTVIVTTGSPMAASTWKLVAAVVDVSGDTIKIYVDGAQQSTSGTVSLPGTTFTNSTSAAAALSSQDDGTSPYFAGKLDEVRIATSARTTGWIATEYNSQSSPSTFYTLGSAVAAPANTVPAAQSVRENQPLVFSSGNGNAISIADPDAGSSSPQVTLSVSHGTVTLSGVSGLTFTSGDGTADATMTFYGTVANVNTALSGMRYTPSTYYVGSDTLTIRTQDATLTSLATDATLKGRYDFENTGALGTDTSPAAGNAGTPTNATAVSDGTRGNVVSFSGTGYIQVSGHFGNPSNVTVAAWASLTTADSSGAEVISLGDSVALRLDDSTNSLNGFFYRGSSNWDTTTEGVTLAGTGWHHVAYSVDDTNNATKLYLDGVLVTSAADANSISYTLGANSFIGKHGNANTAFDFNGRIDDARIYSRVLTAAEIATLAQDLSLVDTDTVAISVLRRRVLVVE